jgi:hypothetical protein
MAVEQEKEADSNKQSSKSSLKKFFKIEAEIDRYYPRWSPLTIRVSKDAQLLARFVGAQYTGPSLSNFR